MRYLVYNFWLFIILSMPVAVSAQVSTRINPETQQRSWLLTTAEGFELTLTQITPDQAHGFFLARGFPSNIAHDIATQCPMQTIIKNTGASNTGMAMTVLLKEWQIKTKTNRENKVASEKNVKSIKLKETWHQEWQDQQLDIPVAAQLAFRWATFPSEQTFQPSGDYNWGITTMGMGLSASSVLSSTHSFDLNVVWYQNGIQKNEWIDAVSCAKN